MAKGSNKYYGVRVGRDGPRIYRSWDDCEKAVKGFPSAVFQGFATLQDAEVYVYDWAENNLPSPSSSSTAYSPTAVDPRLHLPGVYYADPNPAYSIDEGEADYIPLPSSSPIKYNATRRSRTPQLKRSSKPTIRIKAEPIDVIDLTLSSPERLSCPQSRVKRVKREAVKTENLGDVTNPGAHEEWEGVKKEESPAAMDALPKATAPSGPPLSKQQEEVVERVLRGENVFFTGSAGTGKSVLLRAIIKALGGASKRVAVTASTGIAGVNIGGSTLHSFAGIGLGKEGVEKLVHKVLNQKTARDTWREVQTLIIDEISMIDGSLFDKLEALARRVRYDNRPFGGIQLVVSGDFCQLPPVPDRHDGAPVPITFAFDSNSWKKCMGKPIILNKVFRQDDKAFVHMLNDMRFGKVTDESLKSFQALSRSITYTDGIEPTELYPLRYEVEQANASRLAQLSDSSRTYKAFDIPGTDIRGNPISQKDAEKLLDRLVALKEITLKVGAQVMLIKNLAQGSLVNGSLGKVVAFKTTKQARVDMNDIAQVDASQDKKADTSDPTADLKAHFQKHGMFGNVPHEKAVSDVPPGIMDKISGEERVWPLVRFTNGRELLCVPVEFHVENCFGTVEAKRDQVPLILAWALSVHKSQGQTIERVKVNLRKTFEKGQAYVALSRATNMNTLQVLNFDASKVMAHPRVLEWHTNLMQKINEEEEEAILAEMDDEEALRAFFEE